MVEKSNKTDLVFNLLICLGVGLCFLLSIVFIFKPTNVSAKEVTNNVNIGAKAYMPCGVTSSNNSYCAYTMDPTYNVRSTNTTYNGVLNGLTFQISDMINTHSQYTMIIEAMSTDFRNNNLQVDVMASNSSTQLGTQIYNYTYSFVSKSKIQIIFTPDSYNFHTIVLTGYPLTGVSTYGIRKVTLSYDDGINDNSDIINNQTQNTSDIISNNNSNTQDIMNNNNENTNNLIDNQNDNQTQTNAWFKKMQDLIANTCPNLFGNFKVVNGFNINSSGTYINDANSSLILIPVIQGQQYILQANTDRPWVYNFKVTNAILLNTSGSSRTVTGGTSTTFTVPNGYDYLVLRNYPSNNENYQNQQVMLTFGNTKKTYCVYGSMLGGSKLDDLNTNIQNQVDAQEQTNDILTDDTIDSNTGADFFNDFSTTNPGGISSIVTKPLVLINNLLSNNNSCANLSLPDFMGATNVSLPSGCILWNSAPNSVITIWNIFVCGLGSYYVLKQLFKIVEELKSPDNDKVEVLDL